MYIGMMSSFVYTVLLSMNVEQVHQAEVSITLREIAERILLAYLYKIFITTPVIYTCYY